MSRGKKSTKAILYSQNGIEALLVDRMRAKQLKEEARNRRNRGNQPVPPVKQNKRKIKQEALMSPLIKLEGDELLDDFPLFPGFFDPNHDLGIQDDFSLGTDFMALKGQVWPGMGKMDLADDDMRRTRNQKKPKSVIDRMKRASERIEPTQVIMTSKLEVERTKDVYDDASSPAPGQEESTPPRKAPRTKRKKATPLAEISGNVPKQRRTARGSKSSTGKKTGLKKKQSQQKEPETIPSADQKENILDIFRDNNDRPASISEPPIPTSRSDRRFDLRNKHGARSMDNFLNSNLVSPTPQSRDLATRKIPAREGFSSLRPESFPPGSFGHAEASYALKNATIYNASSRLPFVPSNFDQLRGLGPEQFHLAADYGYQLKQEEYPGSISGEATQGTNNSPFMGLSGASPLFPQDRSYLNPYSQGAPNATFSPLSFSSMSRQQDHSNNDREMKVQTHICEAIESNNGLGEQQDLDINGSWNLHDTNNDLDFSHGLTVDDPHRSGWVNEH
ncbi:hypothetical protein F53441_8074 [Fusarium austroafricanum]|uniref:Uncharacterized protein n=1 Tax=Fusarium austroafricanum TaxID=2364996 RepID=A0A8H4KFV4_9HYPO|nr:hypothetical protein F53441_8074 [Fusarium austroafricanum]